MAWVEENNVKGQEAYRVDRLEAHRRVDTTPKADTEVDGREPTLEGVNEFRREHGAGTSLEDTYGARVPAQRPEGA